MEVTQNGRETLDLYYRSNSGAVGTCKPSDKTKCCSLGPYGPLEFFNYILKMLVLPGAIAAAIIFLALFAVYDNLVTQTISFFLTYIATVLIFIYRYEQIMGEINHITVGEDLPEGTFEVNPTGPLILKIGFVGDIMMMGDFKLTFDPSIKRFFDGVDFIVGNLEGIITTQNPSGAEQAHPETILDPLYSLLSGSTKWLLCVSNNHSIDFGNNNFIKSIKTIQNLSNNQYSKKFYAIGRNDVPRAFLGNYFCLSTATKWSNQKTWKCTSRFRNKKLDKYYSKNRFNILYPHWGYENEKYTRRSIQKKAKKLLTRESERNAERKEKKWDLIFGHHPHTRQPIVKIKQKDDNGNVLFNKLVAFSGGNLTSGAIIARRKKHIHGIIMRCEIGPLNSDPNQLAVGKGKWKKTFNKDDPNNPKTRIVEIGEGETGVNRIYLLIIAIAVTVATILLTIFG